MFLLVSQDELLPNCRSFIAIELNSLVFKGISYKKFTLLSSKIELTPEIYFFMMMMMIRYLRGLMFQWYDSGWHIINHNLSNLLLMNSRRTTNVSRNFINLTIYHHSKIILLFNSTLSISLCPDNNFRSDVFFTAIHIMSFYLHFWYDLWCIEILSATENRARWKTTNVFPIAPD